MLSHDAKVGVSEAEWDSLLAPVEADHRPGVNTDSVWRNKVARQLANCFPSRQFPTVQGIYLIGSTNSGECGSRSDIDFTIHLKPDLSRANSVEAWFRKHEPYLLGRLSRTFGVNMEELFDIHFVTTREVDGHLGFASSIGSLFNYPATSIWPPPK